MRVFVGSDHAGFELKQHLVGALAAAGHDVVDVGPSVYRDDDDYPVYCLHVAARMMAEPNCLGVVIGGSGNGEQISANKVRGVRAALAWSVTTAQLARQHNAANVVAIGARMHTPEEATAIVTAFLETPFSQDERHERRIIQIAEYEATRELPPLPSS
jgi:ribose 5-phosphate isomerase B